MRTPTHSLNSGLEALFGAIEREPWAWDFHQALRRIECLSPASPRIGTAARPADEPIRLGQEPSLGFAPATLAGLVPGDHAGAGATADRDVHAGADLAVGARVMHRAGDGGHARLVAGMEMEGVAARVGAQRDAAVRQRVAVVVLVFVVAVQVVQRAGIQAVAGVAGKDVLTAGNRRITLLGVHVQRGGERRVDADARRVMGHVQRQTGLGGTQGDGVGLRGVARAAAATTARRQQRGRCQPHPSNQLSHKVNLVKKREFPPCFLEALSAPHRDPRSSWG